MGGRNIRRILLLNGVAALSSLAHASGANADPSFLSYGSGPSLEQLLSGKPGDAGGNLSQDLPLLNDADSVFMSWRDARSSPLTREVQALLVAEQPQQLQVKPATAGSDDAAPVVSLNSMAIDASAGETGTNGLVDGPGSKSDMAPSSGTKSSLDSKLTNGGSLGDDGKSNFAPPAITFETVGFAAAVLICLWFVLLVVIILVHTEQKKDRQRFFTLHGVLRRSSSSTITHAAREDWALRAHSDALPAYEQRLRDQAANVNIGKGAVHAA